MTDSTHAKIDTLSKASRYVSALGAEVGFDEAVARIQRGSDSAVAGELDQLKRYVGGDSTAAPGRDFALLAEVIRHAPDRADSAQTIGTLNASMTEARTLADRIRVGMPAYLYYSVAVLVVATVILVQWLVYVAPEFGQMFSAMGASLPGFTQLIIDAPWLVYLPIAALGLLIVSMYLGSRRISAAVATLAPINVSWLRFVLGERLVGAYDCWRVATLAKSWVAAGAEPADAVRRAADVLRASGSSLGKLDTDIALAKTLGVAASELDYQLGNSLAEYREAFESRRAFALRSMQLAVAVLVGVIVIAIYLPLFDMGAIV